MDAQGRGQAGDVDPADQWVFNPSSGSYELRPNSVASTSGSTPASPSPVTSPSGDRASRRRAAAPRQRGLAASGRRRIPSQRGQRGGGTPEGAQGGRCNSRRKPKPALTNKQRTVRLTGGALGFLLLAGCIGAFFVYQHFNGNINQVDVGIDNNHTPEGPLNILLLGTDTRSGQGNSGYGDTDSMGHADTTLLFHVAEDRSDATVLSIPRDLITDIPTCPTKQEDGSIKNIPGEQQVRFNTSLGQRGRDPGCTWRTVEKLTGLKINHFMMADFEAVKTLSTAVGGVDVCVAKNINDPKSHLQLTAGKHTLAGEKALAFVRTRYSVGTGSDLSRIELQQQFLSSMIRKMKAGDTLTNPRKLWSLGEAATKALTVDTGIGTVKKLINLAKDLKEVNPKNISFVTLPVLDNPVDKATIILDENKARPLFQMIKADNSLTPGKSKKKKKPVEKAPASEVRVDVRNGGGKIGAAQEIVDWLQNDKGVRLSTNAGNAAGNQSRTTLRYGADQAGQAAALADMMGLPGSALKKTSQNVGPAEPMVLTLGADFSAAGQPIAAPTEAPEGINNINGGDKDICAQ